MRSGDVAGDAGFRRHGHRHRATTLQTEEDPLAFRGGSTSSLLRNPGRADAAVDGHQFLRLRGREQRAVVLADDLVRGLPTKRAAALLNSRQRPCSSLAKIASDEASAIATSIGGGCGFQLERDLVLLRRQQHAREPPDQHVEQQRVVTATKNHPLTMLACTSDSGSWNKVPIARSDSRIHRPETDA